MHSVLQTSLWVIERNLLCPGKPTRKKFPYGACGGHVVALLDALDGPESLSHTLGLVGELQEELGAKGGPAEGRADGALLTGNGANAPLDDKIVEVLPSHELEDLGSKLRLALSESPHLTLQGTHLVVE
jgi:hypothetical protein